MGADVWYICMTIRRTVVSCTTNIEQYLVLISIDASYPATHRIDLLVNIQTRMVIYKGKIQLE